MQMTTKAILSLTAILFIGELDDWLDVAHDAVLYFRVVIR